MDDPRDAIERKSRENSCSNQELCDLLLFAHQEHNKTLGAGLRLPFHPDSLRNLLNKVFAASLIEEEGRHPQVRLVLGSDNETMFPFPAIVRFEPAAEVDVADDLRKLAPAVSDPSCALWIVERDKGDGRQLECVGIVDLDRLYATSRIDTPDSIVRGDQVIGNTSFVVIRIDGPGAIRARVALDRWECVLRGCQIRASRCFAYLEEIVNQVTLIETTLSAGMDLKNDIALALARVLETANSKRHGATFLLLPETRITCQEIHQNYGIEGGHEVLLDLGEALIEFGSCRHRFQAIRPGVGGLQAELTQCPADLISLANKWYEKRRNLALTLNAVAGLSGVDGCVVLDRGLRVHLFGAKIRSRQNRTVIDPDTKNDLSAEMKKLGTRNNSACEFCGEYPGAYAFVLSQDSDIRLYYSDAQNLYALLNLDIYTF